MRFSPASYQIKHALNHQLPMLYPAQQRGDRGLWSPWPWKPFAISTSIRCCRYGEKRASRPLGHGNSGPLISCQAMNRRGVAFKHRDMHGRHVGKSAVVARRSSVAGPAPSVSFGWELPGPGISWEVDASGNGFGSALNLGRCHHRPCRCAITTSANTRRLDLPL